MMPVTVFSISTPHNRFLNACRAGLQPVFIAKREEKMLSRENPPVGFEEPGELHEIGFSALLLLEGEEWVTKK